jgi:hypothetical protein
MGVPHSGSRQKLGLFHKRIRAAATFPGATFQRAKEHDSPTAGGHAGAGQHCRPAPNQIEIEFANPIVDHAAFSVPHRLKNCFSARRKPAMCPGLKPNRATSRGGIEQRGDWSQGLTEGAAFVLLF